MAASFADKEQTVAKTMARIPNFDPFDSIPDIIRPDASVTPRRAGEGRLAFAPAFDVRESKRGIEFETNLPGLKESDLELSLFGNRFTISARREVTRTESRTFSRTFTVPVGIDPEAVDATLADGTLTVFFARLPDLQ